MVESGRLVHVLDRKLAPDSIDRLAEFLAYAAEAELPEFTLPRVVDDVAGWEFSVMWSAEDWVELVVLVIGDADDQEAEEDGLGMKVERTALRAAARRARGWL